MFIYIYIYIYIYKLSKLDAILSKNKTLTTELLRTEAASLNTAQLKRYCFASLDLVWVLLWRRKKKFCYRLDYITTFPRIPLSSAENEGGSL